MDLHLNPDGPHSDDYTRAVAAGLTECVRVLNHATLNPDAITYPATVHDVIGHLRTAVQGLDQLLPQLRAQLRRMHDSGRLDSVGGELTSENRVVATRWELNAARRRASALAEALRRAHNASSGLYLRDGGE
ncbi:hypothetical protein [Nonomuraea rhizosphaerae]|uniref:hypothetical protein n=1 Tax=Nonomuraea rhizosphaerae TaxID=2665663 RepID=UPI001C5EF7A3|nr:hypothetical protein [Nonomuraea rhizosphaerae]